MNRIDKILLLDKAFNQKDILSLKDATKKHSIVLIADTDKGLKRQETPTFGNQITLWNYTDVEIDNERERLLNYHYNVLLIKLCNKNVRKSN